ncbi:MAG: aminodeoxychorismate synthase component I, partial [Steroidobacteraceae bacterium]
MREADLLALHERFPSRYPVLLESVSGAEPLGRHDVLFALPAERLIQSGDGTLAGDVDESREGGRFLDALDRWLARERRARPAPTQDAVFADGWFLYLGYELAAEIEPTLRLPASVLPRAVAWRMHGALLRDRRSGDVRIVARDESTLEQLCTQVAADSASVAQGAERARPAQLATAVVEQAPEIFIAGVRDVLAAIGRGDVYQANLSRSWRARLAEQATVPD